LIGRAGSRRWSRGAAAAAFVERVRIAAGVITEANVSTLGFADLALRRAGDAGRLRRASPSEAPFDLSVFADPPYGASRRRGSGRRRRAGRGRVASLGVFVVLERPAGSEITLPPELRATWERTFGDTLVVFLEPSSAP
jgi:16S rRNA G966 N2-methylase RsmD